ncbi:NUDIX hydrolase [Streptococcus ovis]|uniref:NUDIX hydrolase n=1 Tax=Streptococcus ovis TaxID=82806 RepID=UPI00037743F6|nr:NUDIX domain-containing protein [Streptococcus ovis]
MDFRTMNEQGSFGVRATALIVRDNHIYLAKSPLGTYYSIGGAILFGETTEEAVKREVKEEIGITVAIQELAFVVENHFTIDERAFHQIEFHYLVEPLEEPNPYMEEWGGRRTCEWVPFTELEKIDVQPPFLKTALQNWNGQLQHIINKDGEL